MPPAATPPAGSGSRGGCGRGRGTRASRASAIAAADANRSAGSAGERLARDGGESGGIDPRTSAGSGTGPVSRARATDAALSPSHGRCAGEHLVQHDAQGEDVRLVRRVLAAGLLRAEVVDRSQGRAGQRHLRLGDRAGDPEVDHLDPPVAADEHVARLHVAVDDAPGMAAASARADGGGDPGGLGGREGAVAPQDRGEVLAVDVLHDDERPRRVLAVVVDRDDVGMTQRRGVLRLLAEARREVGIAQVLGTEQLDRDLAPELGIERAVDGRHATLAEQLHEPVAAAKDGPDLGQMCPSTYVRRAAVPRRAPRGMVPHEPRSAARQPPVNGRTRSRNSSELIPSNSRRAVERPLLGLLERPSGPAGRRPAGRSDQAATRAGPTAATSRNQNSKTLGKTRSSARSPGELEEDETDDPVGVQRRRRSIGRGRPSAAPRRRRPRGRPGRATCRATGSRRRRPGPAVAQQQVREVDEDREDAARERPAQHRQRPGDADAAMTRISRVTSRSLPQPCPAQSLDRPALRQYRDTCE